MFLDTKGRIRAAAIAFLAVTGCAITAHAGECPADQRKLDARGPVDHAVRHGHFACIEKRSPRPTRGISDVATRPCFARRRACFGALGP